MGSVPNYLIAFGNLRVATSILKPKPHASNRISFVNNIHPPSRELTEFSSVVLIGSSVRSMAQACRRILRSCSSINLWAIDQFADHDCVSIVDKVSQLELGAVTLDLFTTAVQKDPANLLFLPGGGTENHPLILEQIAARYAWCGLVGEPLRSIRNPQIALAVAKDIGLNAPRTISHKTHPNWQSFASQLEDLSKNTDWLWKSADQGGGLGVSHVQSPEELKYLYTHSNAGYLQQRIAGTPFGATIIISANGDCEFIGACRLLTASDRVTKIEPTPDTKVGHVEVISSPRGDYPYLFAGALGPAHLSDAVVSLLLAFARACWSEFGIRGWFQVDFILDAQDRAWVLEVNPRWSATMEIYERTSSISLITQHLDAWNIKKQAFTSALPNAAKLCWKDVVYATTDFLWHELHQQRADALNQKYLQRYGWPLIADIPNGKQAFSKGMPIFSLIASANHASELARQRDEARAILH